MENTHFKMGWHFFKYYCTLISEHQGICITSMIQWPSMWYIPFQDTIITVIGIVLRLCYPLELTKVTTFETNVGFKIDVDAWHKNYCRCFLFMWSIYLKHHKSSYENHSRIMDTQGNVAILTVGKEMWKLHQEWSIWCTWTI